MAFCLFAWGNAFKLIYVCFLLMVLHLGNFFIKLINRHFAAHAMPKIKKPHAIAWGLVFRL
ncbi:hypothetical protein Q765_19130 [Flavobacterium rivuli WB 3.3-2 = DSM 21788]|uniref:Uncharacterized protein n=1 Tax=Flavobacterium rivuli WB 3.3-2 = DSM 21788 TaxID=1121895 RepID=A0A0A2LWY2_9FLAO|nr:hypothetical protein Q765_19130 [Flavobacterium rivuli WB 3.3-2 = DSM 21788]